MTKKKIDNKSKKTTYGSSNRKHTIEEELFVYYDKPFGYSCDKDDINPFDYDKINYNDIDDILFWIGKAYSSDGDTNLILKNISKDIYEDMDKVLKLSKKISIERLKKYINPVMFSNEKFIYELVSIHQTAEFLYKLIDDSLKKDRKFLLELVKMDYNYFEYLDDKYKNDKKFILDIYNSKKFEDFYDLLFPYVNDSLKNDIDIVKAAINCNIWELKHIPEKFKKDKDIIELALNKDSSSYEYLYEYIDDKKYIKELFNKYHFSMEYLPDDIRKLYNNDKEFMKDLILKDYMQINFLSDELKHDKQYIKELIIDCEYAFEFDDSFRDIFEDYDYLIDIIKSKKDIDYVYILPIPKEIFNSGEFKKDMKKLGFNFSE